jgi:hypothetical protein
MDFTGSEDREDYGHFALLAFLDEQVWSARERSGHWLAAVWGAVRAGKTGLGPWSALNSELKNDGGLSGLFLRYVKEAAFPLKDNGLLAQLHKTFGPPAAATLARGEGKKIFALGPMAAQLLTCQINRRTNGGIVKIVDHRGRVDTTVLAFRVNEQRRIRRGIPQEVPRAQSLGKTKVWEIPIEKDGSEATEYVLAVCQPNHVGRSVVFTAEWQ